MARADQRKTFDEATRLSLLEGDIDELNDKIDDFRKHVDERLDRQDRRIGVLLTTAVTLLGSVMTGVVLLLITLVTR